MSTSSRTLKTPPSALHLMFRAEYLMRVVLSESQPDEDLDSTDLTMLSVILLDGFVFRANNGGEQSMEQVSHQGRFYPPLTSPFIYNLLQTGFSVCGST